MWMEIPVVTHSGQRLPCYYFLQNVNHLIFLLVHFFYSRSSKLLFALTCLVTLSFVIDLVIEITLKWTAVNLCGVFGYWTLYHSKVLAER